MLGGAYEHGRPRGRSRCGRTAAVPTTATPIDIASCWTDSSSPEAEPTSCGATPARITSNIGTNTIPMPNPVIASGPARSQAVRLPPASASRARPRRVRRPSSPSRHASSCDRSAGAAPRSDRAADCRERDHHGGDAAGQRAEAEPELEHHVQGDHHPAHRADEPDDDGEPGDVRTAPKDRRLHQRHAPRARAPCLPRGERRKDRDPPASIANDHAASPAPGPRSADTRARRRLPSPAPRWGASPAAPPASQACRGRLRAPTTIAARPTGMLTRKIVRHPRPATFRFTSPPPISGPATAAEHRRGAEYRTPSAGSDRRTSRGSGRSPAAPSRRPASPGARGRRSGPPASG